METKELIKALNVFNDLRGHIVYDKGLKCLCYSFEFLKAKQSIIDFITEELKERGCIFK